MVRFLVFSLLVCFASQPAITPARAEVQTLLDSPTAWSVIGEDGRYYATFGRGTSASGGAPEFAFVFNVPSRRFSVFFARPIAVSGSASIPITIQFRSASAAKPLPPLRLTAGGTDKLTAILTDADVATWTHGFTAGVAMTVIFANTSWNFDLAGTTPAITAMAGAIGGAGIDGLPPPWQLSGYANAPTSGSQPNGAAQDRAAEAAAQKRQLDIANAEAAKAKSDAQRAQADAERARAEADRAQAQAQIEADAKAKAAEEARATAMRLAEEQRRKSAQAKAELDARGTEP